MERISSFFFTQAMSKEAEHPSSTTHEKEFFYFDK
jgi:hypothetical protein